MQNLSIIGRDFCAAEKYLRFFTPGGVAKSGAKIGAGTGGVSKLFVAGVFLVLPTIGPVAIAGPLAAALLIGIEGALAGSTFDGLAGALVALGVSKDKALRFESQAKAGKFLLALQGDGPQVHRAKSLFIVGKAETAEVFGPVVASA